MNTTTLNLRNTVDHSAPRGATWIGHVAAALAHLFAAAPRSVSSVEARRDARLARELASQWQQRDPRGAADLSAAVDRFEAQNGL